VARDTKRDEAKREYFPLKQRERRATQERPDKVQGPCVRPEWEVVKDAVDVDQSATDSKCHCRVERSVTQCEDSVIIRKDSAG